MNFFWGLGFITPWVLVILLIVPILWLVLRAVPPAPKRIRFPGVSLLIGLKDNDVQSDKTPWWLLFLRAIIFCCLIVGFAGPIFNIEPVTNQKNDLLIVMEGSWADAANWKEKKEVALRVVRTAGSTGRKVAFLQLTDSSWKPVFSAASIAGKKIQAAYPNAWLPDLNVAEIIANLGDFDSYWIASGLQWPGQSKFRDALLKRGSVKVLLPEANLFGLLPISLGAKGVEVHGVRLDAKKDENVRIDVKGLDPSGIERTFQTNFLKFKEGTSQTSQTLVLPRELRNRMTKIVVVDQSSSAGVRIIGDNTLRPEVAIISGDFSAREGLKLLSPEHYLTKALEPYTDLIQGAIEDVLLANPNAIIFADVANFTSKAAIVEWVEEGGTLIRFAGPNLASAQYEVEKIDPLMPVKLRMGGRSLGGAMSWGSPKTLKTFENNSPFFGLKTPDEVIVMAQVLAQPTPDLSAHVIARLSDGTPLVTRKLMGEGQVVLFHVTANTDWSNLPISGLFVSMLDRLVNNGPAEYFEPLDLTGTTWKLSYELDAFGNLSAVDDRSGIDGQTLFDTGITSKTPPGVYEGRKTLWTRNVLKENELFRSSNWPSSVNLVEPSLQQPQPLMAWLLIIALVFLGLDVFLSLWLSGKLSGVGLAFVLLFSFINFTPQGLMAQPVDDRAIAATRDVILAFVRTGDRVQDEISFAGLSGLSLALSQRTSIEPAAPFGVSLDVDELSFYPFLYWAITPGQALPTAETLKKLNRYLEGGGLILFDTKDAEFSQFGQSTIEENILKKITIGLNLPPISRITKDHVLTRSFYLLQDFPGRYAGGTVWVEASYTSKMKTAGVPFSNSNDGVTPVVIGGNDWASAWAIDGLGLPLLPVGRGVSGDRQREIALRFGINLIMHTLTGNYKSDQVHVPALLKRLGK